jgi:hypothetical protein
MFVPAFAHEGLHRFAVAVVHFMELCWIVQLKMSARLLYIHIRFYCW